MKNASDHEIDSAISARAQGFLNSLLSFEFFFILSIIIIIFEQIEILNTELQKKELCVNESHASVCAVINNMQNMRDEKIFSKIWSDIEQTAEDVGVEKLCLKRSRRTPKHLECSSNNDTHIFSTPEEYFRKIYFEIIDTAVTSLQSRFTSETINLLNMFENFIVGEENVKVTEITKFFNIQIGNKENIDFDEKRLRNERDLILNAINNDEGFKKKLKDLKKNQSS